MKSLSTEQDNKQTSPQQEHEGGKRQWVILALFLLAVISIGAFFVLRVVLERVP